MERVGLNKRKETDNFFKRSQDLKTMEGSPRVTATIVSENHEVECEWPRKNELTSREL